jgi:hypothetical protein
MKFYGNLTGNIFILICLSRCILSITQCNDHAFITLLILEKNIVESFLEPGFSLAENHPLQKYMEKNEYPVLLEFGEQNECVFISSFTKHSFTEFKFEIPFVEHINGYKAVYKSQIYASSYLDTIGSLFMYGLPTSKAEMEMTDGAYTFSSNKGKVTVKVTHTDERWGTLKEYPNFQYFIDIGSSQFYCYTPWRTILCASVDYQKENLKIRPVKLVIKIEGNILGTKLADQSFSTNDIKEFELGSAEMIIPIDISFPYSCKK